MDAKTTPKRGYADFAEHLDRLDGLGLVRRIDAEVNKDTELHPLVRWQYRGGIPDEERKAFVFSNVTDAKGRKFDMPVVVGAMAGSRAIYRAGLGVDADGVGPIWARAIDKPIPPVEVSGAPAQEIILEGDDLKGPGKGLDALPVPISTPGYDSAPYITAGNFATRDPDTGVQNLGTYRGGLKAADRIGVRMSTRSGGAGGYPHWLKYQARGEKMPCAIVLGCPPVVAYTGPQKLPMGIDELAVAGGLAGEPIRVTRCHSIDLLVPAEAEIIIEGLIDTEYLEPEAPFGESHGHIALEDFNMIFDVTAITRKKDALFASIISQVTPSESSAIKRDAYEQMFLSHLRNSLGIRGVQNVVMHEPLSNIRRVIFLVMAPGTPKTEVWRALYGASSLRADCGKYVMAVSEDINPDNGDAVFWSLAYRANPAEDVVILGHRDGGHGPKGGDRGSDGTMLVDATLKHVSAPLALPKKPYMEHAKEIWERLQLPPLSPETPWHGYSLGDWSDEWDALAARATDGDYLSNGERSKQMRAKGIKPNTPVRDVLKAP
ncbi:MAG: UbiD family decarboxylase [Rhodospirillaceae bacterium]|nr:UbiD family decarboxylase [Rhodospirillaceae bacterium]MBT4751518.1 UbiD family decarboxylase [Rhodospirillaceae bacterium]MBT7031815.1 UbiD family decarboxylase [Rhodospirillaceae bacterium]MBT7235024.1 UbiD family decarboxylase [Rhodospirillaceae bacterium]MBT7568408.1 UbiD family decarboxylase [Rhodospirillaceae bacterium]